MENKMPFLGNINCRNLRKKVYHLQMVRDGLSTREKASTGADFIAFPITPQHRSMRTPKRGVRRFESSHGRGKTLDLQGFLGNPVFFYFCSEYNLNIHTAAWALCKHCLQKSRFLGDLQTDLQTNFF